MPLPSIIVNLFFFVVSCLFLVKSSNVLVKSLTKIAYFLKLNEFTIGFIVMAISTSLPELFVGITSAFHHNSVLALGNVIGSNILDMTFVVGIVMGIFYQPRSWCQVCPMGHATGLIAKAKASK